MKQVQFQKIMNDLTECSIVRESAPDMVPFEGRIREHLYFRLLPYDRNAGALRYLPHIRWLDLALVFFLILPDGEGEMHARLIDEPARKLWNRSLYDLWTAAKQNTLRDFPPKILALADFLQDHSGTEIEESPLMMLTNECFCNGSVMMYFTEILERYAEDCAAPFFILPSSVHEVLLLRDDGSYEPEMLKEMVSAINAEHVSLTDFLSNRIYYFTKEDGVRML